MIWNDHHKIGVIGTYHSGKTVFLTSLINHLIHHHPEKFKLDKSSNSQITKAEFLKEESDFPSFPYEAHRDALVRMGKWPQKTLQASQKRLGLHFNQGMTRYCDLSLFDFPGEILADASIAALNYKAWSQSTLEHIQAHEEEKAMAAPFLNLLETTDFDVSQAIHQYKLYLAKKRKAFRPLIQPSSFILSDTSGLIQSQLDTEDMIQDRFLGEENAEFIPLSEKLIQAQPELYKEIQAHYNRYREKKVLPLFKELASCDSLLIMADIPTMLNSGSSMCNDTLEMVKACLDFCQPGKSAFDSIYSISQLPQIYRRSTSFIKSLPLIGGLSDVLFGSKSPLESIGYSVDQFLGLKKIKHLSIVASKCDLVHERDRDQLKFLLKELFQSTASSHAGLELSWHNMSASVATRSSAEHHALIGKAELSESDSEEVIKVSELPPQWPHQWQAGEFCFPDFKPKSFPGLKVQSPEHYNLDVVFNHLMGWSS